MLAAGSRSPEDVYLQVFLIDIDFYVVVQLREGLDSRETGVPAALESKGEMRTSG